MMLLSVFMMLIIFLSSLIMGLSSALSKKTFKDREKNSPFECGFDPKSSARLPFSLRFFLIAVIFLIFDVEITLLLPIPMALEIAFTKDVIITSSIFLLVLLIGLYHEWHQGALEWSE